MWNNFYKTLRGRLLLWLLIPLLILSLAHLSSLYVNTKRASTELFDRNLINLALSISEYAISSEGDLLTTDLLELIKQTTQDKLFYKVLGPNGSFIVGYSDMPKPSDGLKQIHNHIELYDAVYLGEPVRIIAVSMLSERAQFSGWTEAYVAQTLKDRDAYVLDIMLDNLARILILIIAIAILLNAAVVIALRPISELTESLSSRDIHDLTPVASEALPGEIATIADNVNALFERLAQQIALTRRFLENASHQLLTPITALSLQCDIAERQLEKAGDRQAMAKIKANSDRISRLAHQLLQLSYSEAGAFDHSEDVFISLPSLVEDYLDEFRDYAPNQLITADLGEASIVGNEILIVELLANLLENAKKYGGEAPILISTYNKEDTLSLIHI